jgi:hypothetical protein
VRQQKEGYWSLSIPTTAPHFESSAPEWRQTVREIAMSNIEESDELRPEYDLDFSKAVRGK